MYKSDRLLCDTAVVVGGILVYGLRRVADVCTKLAYCVHRVCMCCCLSMKIPTLRAG